MLTDGYYCYRIAAFFLRFVNLADAKTATLLTAVTLGILLFFMPELPLANRSFVIAGYLVGVVYACYLDKRNF